MPSEDQNDIHVLEQRSKYWDGF